MQEVGSLLDAKAVHTGRSAFNHLLAMGATHGIGKTRVGQVIEMTGLESLPRSGSEATPSAWASASVSRPPCWATRTR